jgi:hypothetical protein
MQKMVRFEKAYKTSFCFFAQINIKSMVYQPPTGYKIGTA